MSFEAGIDELTSKEWVAEDWPKILNLCRKINNDKSATSCLLAITNKIETSEEFIVVWLACSLLDICFRKSGELFRSKVASEEFEILFRKLLHNSRDHPKKYNILTSLLLKWVETNCKNDAQMALISALHKKLAKEGHKFANLNSMCNPWTFKDEFPVSNHTYISSLSQATIVSHQIDKGSEGALIQAPFILKLCKDQLAHLIENCNNGMYQEYKNSQHIRDLKMKMRHAISSLEAKLNKKNDKILSFKQNLLDISR